MSKWMNALLSFGIVSTLVSPAPAAELTIWDFTLTYVFDAVGVTADYQVEGLYSHKIECATDWELVSTVTAPIADPSHVIVYKASYSEGLFRIIERLEGTQTITTLQCPSFSLVAVPVVAAPWSDVCSGYCPRTASRTYQGLAPVPASTSQPTPYLYSSACVCAGGAQTSNVGAVPYTGEVYGALDIPGPAGIYRYALHGTMVGGVVWESTASGTQNQPSWPTQFSVIGQARGPFGVGVGAGTWRFWWNGN
jgi:hypothetical protein